MHFTLPFGEFGREGADSADSGDSTEDVVEGFKVGKLFYGDPAGDATASRLDCDHVG